jgi:hypothetical protein
MLAVFSSAFELLGIVDGAAGTGAGFECVLPVAGGCDALDLLLLDFAPLETAAGVFEAELTVLAVEGVECMLALVPAGCGLELLSVVAGFFIGEDAEFDGDAGCALAPAPLLTDAEVADVEFAAGRTSAAVDNTISTGALGNAWAAVDDGTSAAGACAGATAAAGGAATLLATSATVGAELGATLAEAEAGAAAATALRACALAAACARLAAIAGVLLVSSSNGGKFGNVLSGTQPSTPLAEWIFTKPFTRPTISTVSPHFNFAATSKLPSDSYTQTRS